MENPHLCACPCKAGVATFAPFTRPFDGKSPFHYETDFFERNLAGNVRVLPCHLQADQYISLNDPVFLGKVQLDFAWSIQADLTSRAGAQPDTKNEITVGRIISGAARCNIECPVFLL
ncbi:MAG: hypothetical protein ACKVUS_10045 [Saprospiraceae bacterium]